MYMPSYYLYTRVSKGESCGEAGRARETTNKLQNHLIASHLDGRQPLMMDESVHNLVSNIAFEAGNTNLDEPDRIVVFLAFVTSNQAIMDMSSMVDHSSLSIESLLSDGGISSERMQNKTLEDNVWEEDGLPSIDIVEKILKCHAKALKRCVELTSRTTCQFCIVEHDI
ncbi:hypothetical protein EDB19DRAFT_1962423 [Suillus lakei]|nr:hypothetical protein EDB19DRAFT_1962423 [Suillus lakei]